MPSAAIVLIKVKYAAERFGLWYSWLDFMGHVKLPEFWWRQNRNTMNNLDDWKFYKFSLCVTSDSHHLVLLQLQHVDVSFDGLILIFGKSMILLWKHRISRFKLCCLQLSWSIVYMSVWVLSSAWQITQMYEGKLTKPYCGQAWGGTKHRGLQTKTICQNPY